MDNPIVERIQFAIRLELQSPLCIGSGEDYYTDRDVLTDFDGMPFIPGSSVAGALRDYLGYGGYEKECLFGFAQGEEGKMSPLTISDICFEKGAKISLRDGVKLKEGEKIAESKEKFEMEIIENGIAGMLFLGLIIRQSDVPGKKQKYQEELKKAFYGIHYGDIRFGAKKTRGFGKFGVLNIYRKSFCYGEPYKSEPWYEFHIREHYEELVDEKTNWIPNQRQDEEGNPYVILEVPLKQSGGISIRRYSAKEGAPDFEHITCNEKPIIPGSSWAGAIRGRSAVILNALGVENYKAWIEQAFGYVDKEKKDAEISKVSIEESLLDQGTSLVMTRNRISRFEAATVTGALYQERSHFNGDTTLCMKVKKGKDDTDWIVGLLLYVIYDIQNGYLAIGGQTAIGRGIFKAAGRIKISTGKGQEHYKKALAMAVGRKHNAV